MFCTFARRPHVNSVILTVVVPSHLRPNCSGILAPPLRSSNIGLVVAGVVATLKEFYFNTTGYMVTDPEMPIRIRERASDSLSIAVISLCYPPSLSPISKIDWNTVVSTKDEQEALSQSTIKKSPAIGLNGYDSMMTVA